ncbi:MAG: sulfotransferase domain-containing protein [Acidobacteria bacterium]|nr:sulfotransferase domain-containing protein [Acidobacteriota bacterium]
MTDVLKDFVLILNPAKCGSSWLAHGLTVRPYVSFSREFDFLYFLDFPLERQWNQETVQDSRFLEIHERTDLSADEKLVLLYEIERGDHPKVGLLIDKAPSNIHSFLKYRHLFRETKTVFLYRDPRDCYISNELFHQRQLGKIGRFDDIGDPDYLREGSVLRATLTNCAKVARAENQLRDDGVAYLRITYEEMKADFSNVLRRVLAFLELDITDETLVRSHYIPHRIPLAEHLQRAHEFKPLFRKGIVGDWKNYITSTAGKDVVKELAGDLLVDLGYEQSADW